MHAKPGPRPECPAGASMTARPAWLDSANKVGLRRRLSAGVLRFVLTATLLSRAGREGLTTAGPGWASEGRGQDSVRPWEGEEVGICLNPTCLTPLWASPSYPFPVSPCNSSPLTYDVIFRAHLVPFCDKGLHPAASLGLWDSRKRYIPFPSRACAWDEQ